MQEMTDFFKDLNFDRIDSFRLNRLNTISCTQKFNEFEIIDKNGNQIPNGILDNNNNLNPTAELVTSTKDFEIVNKLKNLLTISTDVPITLEIPLFKTALLFYSNDILIKGINISFRQGIFHSTTNEILSLSENDFELFRLFMKLPIILVPLETIGKDTVFQIRSIIIHIGNLMKVQFRLQSFVKIMTE
jgi:hypothetical protein